VDGQNGQKFRPRFYRLSATELISNDLYLQRSTAFHQITFSHSLNVILAHSRRRHQLVPKSRGSWAAATDQ
jgi:hypothetical protein